MPHLHPTCYIPHSFRGKLHQTLAKQLGEFRDDDAAKAALAKLKDEQFAVKKD
jgi:hypothetical protein